MSDGTLKHWVNLESGEGAEEALERGTIIKALKYVVEADTGKLTLQRLQVLLPKGSGVIGEPKHYGPGASEAAAGLRTPQKQRTGRRSAAQLTPVKKKRDTRPLLLKEAPEAKRKLLEFGPLEEYQSCHPFALPSLDFSSGASFSSSSFPFSGVGVGPQPVMVAGLRVGLANWSIEGTAVARSPVIKFQSRAGGRGRLMHFDLCDAEGGKVRCNLYGKLVDQHCDLLTVGSHYALENAVVKPRNPKYTAFGDFELSLNSNSILEPTADRVQRQAFFHSLVPDNDDQEKQTNSKIN
ncbi:MAG: hypothetical protein Q8P67_20315 [archaeon]|nr:hypothetical protein [archaeon]